MRARGNLNNDVTYGIRSRNDENFSSFREKEKRVSFEISEIRREKKYREIFIIFRKRTRENWRSGKITAAVVVNFCSFSSPVIKSDIFRFNVGSFFLHRLLRSKAIATDYAIASNLKEIYIVLYSETDLIQFLKLPLNVAV